jgi:hypothetical protein
MLYYIGDYGLPFYVFGILMVGTIPLIYSLNIPDTVTEGEEQGEPEFLKSLMNFVN